ncbi:bifunctional 3-(3-hydroxy-phenyl)propionate/3-hydroxycinnamic acid hydroxylase [Nonomuraea monospora]|uniref:Bifunctional 3-(3-hydroxy-phenyl)propionate/3-hydroxycinnamic acid hydroxylase n=1 Tax=Nonomuraea monospora TaxID=568818 RepID=A0ABN3D4L3_9ACTN
MNASANCDVAIVGYGPTGLAAASLLGRLGHRVLVVERWPSLYGLPRLTHIDGETARLIQSVADVDEALHDSCPTEYLWVNGQEQTLVHLPATEDGPMGFPDDISMYQPDVEEAIDSRIRTYRGVEIRQGWVLTDLRQDEAGVTLTLRDWDAVERREGRACDEVRARYVIAADGSRSKVRELLGVERDDLGFSERWLNVDAEWIRPAPEEFALTKQFCVPERGHMFMRIGERRQRFEFALLPGETAEEMCEPGKAWKLLKQLHGLGPDDLRFIRQLVYTFESRIARRWRVGRVFLAGDAAHTMPPYLGQGACGAMRDAVNLGWKLDLVLRGLVEDALLDTYQTERAPHVEALTRASIALGEIANMSDPVQAAARDAAMLSGHATPPPGIPPLLDGVLQRDADAAPVDRAGALTPQGRIEMAGRSGRFDDVVGHGFVLVVRERVNLPAAQAAFLESVGCAVVGLTEINDLDGRHGAFLDELGAYAYLARPDFVLFGAAPDAASVAGLVDDLRSALHVVKES